MKIKSKKQDVLNGVLGAVKSFASKKCCSKVYKIKGGEYVTTIDDKFVSETSEIISSATGVYISYALNGVFGPSTRNEILDYLEEYGGKYVYSIYKSDPNGKYPGYVLVFQNRNFVVVIDKIEPEFNTTRFYGNIPHLISYLKNGKVSYPKKDKDKDKFNAFLIEDMYKYFILVDVTMKRKHAFKQLETLRYYQKQSVDTENFKNTVFSPVDETDLDSVKEDSQNEKEDATTPEKEDKNKESGDKIDNDVNKLDV